MDELPDERKPAMKKLREAILENLPKGFEEVMSYGMIGYVVPHSIYPDGYHLTPELPLPFISIASQKNNISLYHMSLYENAPLKNWFTKEYASQCKTKLDMGKSCIRLKKMDDIPFDLIGKLAGKISVNEWIKVYENNRSKK